jgi:hypothetical protein
MSRLDAVRRRADRLFVLAIAALVLLAAARLLVAGPASTSGPPGAARRQPESADESRIRELVREGRLSDHEALHYRRLPARPSR